MVAQTPTGGTCNQSQLTINTLNRIADTGYSYAAAGNLPAEPGKTHQYDAEGRLVSLNNGCAGSGPCYVYDANGRRVRKVASGVTTEYIYGAGGVIAEKVGTTWTVGYVYLNGQLLAQYKNGTTYFAHKDHLGSTRLLTKPDGSYDPADVYDYLPYGEPVGSTSTTTTHKFTGHERDTESGLDYMGARYYSALIGRLLTADPLQSSARLTAPQSWNRHNYALNNPIRFTDPLGLFVWDESAGGSATDDALEAQSNDKKISKKDRKKAEKALEFRRKFRAALARALEAAASSGLNDQQKANIGRAVAAYGIEGSGGVSVGLRDYGAERGATTKLNEDDTISAKFGSKVKDDDLAVTVAHEGVHVADGQAWLNTHCSNCSTDLDHYARETGAWNVGAAVAQGLNMRSYGPYGGDSTSEVWNRGWEQADRETRRASGISKIMELSGYSPNGGGHENNRYSQEHKHRP